MLEAMRAEQRVRDLAHPGRFHVRSGHVGQVVVMQPPRHIRPGIQTGFGSLIFGSGKAAWAACVSFSPNQRGEVTNVLRDFKEPGRAGDVAAYALRARERPASGAVSCSPSAQFDSHAV